MPPAALDRLVAGRLPAIGRVSLAYVLGARGGVLTEFTITRLAADAFWLLSASSGEWHDRDLLAQHVAAVARYARRRGDRRLHDPRRRRAQVARAARADHRRRSSSAAFPWLSWQPIKIDGATVAALRVNYVGGLPLECT